jgi:hypothetical protein
VRELNVLVRQSNPALVLDLGGSAEAAMLTAEKTGREN